MKPLSFTPPQGETKIISSRLVGVDFLLVIIDGLQHDIVHSTPVNRQVRVDPVAGEIEWAVPLAEKLKTIVLIN